MTTSNNLRNEHIEAIRTLPDQVEALVAGLSDVQLITHSVAGEWNVAQNVHHLVDSHMNSYVRCKLMVTETEPTFQPYDQDAWAELPDASSADLAYSLSMLHALHARWVVFWESLTEAQWQRTGYHPSDDVVVTLEEQLNLYAAHGQAHLDQIQRCLDASGGTP